MNVRRFMLPAFPFAVLLKPSTMRLGVAATQCPRWVKSGSVTACPGCPFYPKSRPPRHVRLVPLADIGTGRVTRHGSTRALGFLPALEQRGEAERPRWA
jgi:hypothetical protein